MMDYPEEELICACGRALVDESAEPSSCPRDGQPCALCCVLCREECRVLRGRMTTAERRGYLRCKSALANKGLVPALTTAELAELAD